MSAFLFNIPVSYDTALENSTLEIRKFRDFSFNTVPDSDLKSEIIRYGDFCFKILSGVLIHIKFKNSLQLNNFGSNQI